MKPRLDATARRANPAMVPPTVRGENLNRRSMGPRLSRDDSEARSKLDSSQGRRVPTRMKRPPARGGYR